MMRLAQAARATAVAGARSGLASRRATPAAGSAVHGAAHLCALAAAAATTSIRTLSTQTHLHAAELRSVSRSARRAAGSASAARAATPPPALSSFAEAGLPAGLVSALELQGLTQPTPIQAASLPTLLTGRSALLASDTGSGKTLAFLVPLVAQLRRDEEAGLHARLARPRAVIVVPNRELAVQILSVAKSLSGASGGRFRSLASTGFIPLRKLARALEQPVDLLVVTPGRLEFLLASNRILLTDVKYAVLDETDTLLDEAQGFRDLLEHTLLGPMKHRLAEASNGKRGEKANKTKKEASEDHLAEPAAAETVAPTQVTQTSPVQMIFCSASITPAIESYVTRQFPSVVRVHTPSLHHLPAELVVRNQLVANEDKRELLWRLLQKESSSYKQRLMHNRTREQNQREIAALGGDEERWWQEIIRKDAEARSGLATPSSPAELHIRNQLRYDEATQDDAYVSTEIAASKEEADAEDRSDPDHPSHLASSQQSAADAPAPSAAVQLPLPPTLIFCNTVSCCRAVAWFLTEQGLNVGHYHGLMPPHYRTLHFKNFLSGATSVLVATDLASRGLDTTFVQHVIHFDYPLQVVDFIHRVGRTARNGRKGKSTALLGKRDRVLADAIDRLTTRGLSIEQLSNDRARYGPDGLPLSAAAVTVTSSSSSFSSAAAASTGVKALPPSRGAAGSARAASAAGRPRSGPLQHGAEPRRRWMRYLSPTERNQHKLLYSYQAPVPSNPPLTVGQMRRYEERGVGRGRRPASAPSSAEESAPSDGGASDAPRRVDPFAFSAPPQFRPTKGELHAAARVRAAESRKKPREATAQQKSERSARLHVQPTRFPSAAAAGRRPSPVRPLGPLAHKQRLGAIFATDAAKPKAKSKAKSNSKAPPKAPTRREAYEAGLARQRASNRGNSARRS